MTLSEWQKRLETHFYALKQDRASTGSHVFALEHGLNEEELGSLGSEIGEFSKHTTPALRHWLAWVVYATEIGYAYSGEEYWHTFSEKTAGWGKHNQTESRDAIRQAFWRFHKEYSGVRPTGPWAEHFTIICWPITHSILPQDLQRNLAEILYELRGDYDEQLLSNPSKMGELIQRASWNTSPRFAQFAEQQLLVGQIACALLLKEEEREGALITPATLARIANDLDRERRAREWLSRARDRAVDVRMGGLSRNSGANKATTPALEREESRDDKAMVEPSLALRRVGEKRWEVRLKLPNLAPLLPKFPKFKRFLAEERCHVAGAKDRRPLARGRLLFPGQEVTLSEWPKQGEVLLRFERSCPELDLLLRTEALIRPGANWLFKVGDDGTARELRTRRIRAGGDYILLGPPGMVLPQDLVKPLAIDCAHVQGFLIQAPDHLTNRFISDLQRLGIDIAPNLDCWPIGTVPAKWDDEGFVEYIAGHQPCIALRSDFQTDGVVLVLDSTVRQNLQWQGNMGSETLFLELPELKVGSYRLHVTALRNQVATTASLRIGIRDPRSIQGGPKFVSVMASPVNATLEELWNDRATVDIYAPEATKIHCEAVLYRDSGCTNLLGSRPFGPFEAPVLEEAFSDRFSTVVEAMQNLYDDAAACVLKFTTTSMGETAVKFERALSACRWGVRFENGGYCLRLFQLDSVDTPKFFVAEFEAPDRIVPAPATGVGNAFRVPSAGGLFCATVKDTRCSVVIPPVIRSLQDLQLQVPLFLVKKHDVSQILCAYEWWNSARIVGNPFSARRKREVIGLLDQALQRAFCGQDWPERSSDTLESNIDTIRRFIDRIFPRLRNSLSKIAREIESFPIPLCAEILARQLRSEVSFPKLSLSGTHGMSSVQWLTEFGIRLFADPAGVKQWAGAEFVSGLQGLQDQRSLSRICRYVSLLRRVDSRMRAAEVVPQ